ncbi:hypothetical protein ACP4OV_017122 [Aristida adscensionis]
MHDPLSGIVTALDFCSATLRPYVFNLTASYGSYRNESTMVATSIAMFVLATLFFDLNLFSRFSDISAILNPSVRLFLSGALSLFLPVMTYLFSEAKNHGAAAAAHRRQRPADDLSLRARTILAWMLLVELLRKKVEAIAGMPGYSGTIERAARIAWLGYLVFFNLRTPGKKALYGILWVLAATKLVQRFVTSELARHSFAHGRNPQLLASYMAQTLQEEHHGAAGSCRAAAAAAAAQLHGSELLKRCSYVVMGEEELEKKASPVGYRLELAEVTPGPPGHDGGGAAAVVTVGKVWELAESDELLRRDPKLKRLCLSFALYKLLRRRLEDFPITSTEARDCHGLIFRGLCEEGTDAEANAVALFKVFHDEVHFLCEYYHSALPVVLASPFFFLINYILFPIVVWTLCTLVIIFCSHGDVAYAFHSFRTDNYGSMVGVATIIRCMLKNITVSRTALYSTIDISITILLALSFAYEEIWEFLVFVVSNWFMVSLLCSYASKSNPRRRASPFMRGVIRRILWLRNAMSQPNVCFKQFSVLWFFRISSALPTMAVPVQAKKAIMERMAKTCGAGAGAGVPPSNGMSALMSEEHRQWLQADELSWACESGGVAEVILTWHVATELLVARHPLPTQAKPGAFGEAATALSGYCAYLVAFHPELLPDDRDGTERVYKDTMAEMKKEMGSWGYYFSLQGARRDTLMEIAGRPDVSAPEAALTTSAAAASALRKGARLGKALIERYAAAADGAARERVWQMVADVWTEVVVYAAPASGELQVKAHREALAQGGEFITVLWAIATHTGVARGAAPGTLSAPPPASAV